MRMMRISHGLMVAVVLAVVLCMPITGYAAGSAITNIVAYNGEIVDGTTITVDYDGENHGFKYSCISTNTSGRWTDYSKSSTNTCTITRQDGTVLTTDEYEITSGSKVNLYLIEPDAGTYTVQVSSTWEWLDTVHVNKTFTVIVNQIELESMIDVVPYDADYDGCAHPSVSVAKCSNVPDDQYTVEYSIDGGESYSRDIPMIGADADAFTVIVRLTGINDNFVERECILTYPVQIRPRPVVITPISVAKKYGEADPELAYVISGALDNEPLTGVSITREPGEAIGVYAIKVTVDEAAHANYVIRIDNAVLTIESIPMTVAVNDIDACYEDGMEYRLKPNVVDYWGNEITDQVLIQYSVNGGSFTSEPPVFTGIGISTVDFLAERENYTSVTGTAMVDLHLHSMLVEEYLEPTCTEVGYTRGEHCERCGKVVAERVEIPALGHNVIVDSAIEPTCTSPGLTEGSHCSVCGEVFVAQEILPAGHDKVVDSEAVAPTCVEPGATEQSHCARCGLILSERTELQPTGHVVVIHPNIEPTDTSPGFTEGSSCSVCSRILVPQKIIANLNEDLYQNQPLPESITSGIVAVNYFGTENAVALIELDADEEEYTLIISGAGTASVTGFYEKKIKNLIYWEGIVRIEDMHPGHIDNVYLPKSLRSFADWSCYATHVQNIYICDLESYVMIFHEGTDSDPQGAATQVWLNGDPISRFGGLDSWYGSAVWILSDDGTLTISGNGDMPDFGNESYASPHNIPWNGYREDICSVEVCEGITRIGNRTFYQCTNLKEIAIPNSVTSMGLGAISHCPSLCEIFIPSSVTEFTGDPFVDCSNLKVVHCVKNSAVDSYLSKKGQYILHYIDQPDSITLNASEKMLLVGSDDQSFVLQVSCVPSEIKPQEVIWTSSNTQVVTVEDGRVTAVKCGEADVSCVYANGNSNTVSCHFIVHEPIVIPGIPATCTENGLKDEIVCLACGFTIQQADVEYAQGHTVVIDPYIPPTTYSTGLTEGSHCSVCGLILQAQEVIEMIVAPSTELACADCISITIPEGYVRSNSVWVDSALGFLYGDTEYGFQHADNSNSSVSVFAFNSPRDSQTMVSDLTEAGYLAVQAGFDNEAGLYCVTGNRNHGDYIVAVLEFSTETHHYIVLGRSYTRDSMLAIAQIALSIAESHLDIQSSGCVLASSSASGATGKIFCASCNKDLVENREIGSDEIAILPARLTAIENSAFRGTAIKQVVIPPGCTAIGSRAFFDSNIAIIVVPDTVEFIGTDAFGECDIPVFVVEDGDSYAAQWALENGYCVWCY